jgi:DNA ligase-1
MAEVVTTSEAVAATSARSAKIAALAGLLARLQPGEVEAVVAFLAGEPRQGRIGVGWATLVALAPEPAAEPTLSVAEVDGRLAEILTTTGSGSAGARAALLTDLLRRATASEADFLRRLLTGELRQGALEGVMTEAVARAAGVPAAAVRRTCMLCGDLGRTAAVALAKGRPGLEAVGLEVGRPLLPMLASSSPGVAEAMDELGLSSVEWKLDGLRIQVHRRGDDVAVYSRNLNDITARLPEVVALSRELPVDRFVLDGEALALGEEQRPRSFQESMRKDERLLARFFDCLHVDGEDLLDRPLSERLEALEQVAGGWRIPGRVTADPAEGEAVLAEALAAGHEGVVVKAVLSPYEAGRRGKAWRKVKVAQTLDLVVLGAEWGHGRRQGWLSNLHLGARGPDGGFVMVGKTFKGMTQKTLEWQTRRFLELETHREGITVFVRHEVVAEIALDGVQVSTRYPGGVTLRFARLKRYREDKSPAEADTIESVRVLSHRPDAQGEEAPGQPVPR